MGLFSTLIFLNLSLVAKPAEISQVQAELTQLVSQPSHFENISGLNATAEIIKLQFLSLGVNLTWSGSDRALFGKTAIEIDAPTILFVGHLDTVFQKEDVKHELTPHPLPKSDWRSRFAPALNGPGSADAKGGIVLALEFLRQSIRNPLPMPLNLAFFFAADEEVGSRTSNPKLQEFVKEVKPALAFVLEPGWMEGGKIIVPNRTAGLYRTEILITRTSEHSGTSKKLGLSAADGIFKVHQFFSKLRRPGVSVHAYSVSGESEPNVTMPSATIRYDIRYADPSFLKTLHALFTRLEKDFDKTDMNLRFVSSKSIREPEVILDPKLFKLIQSTAKELKLFPVETRASMARGAEGFLHKIGVPTVPAFGPFGFDYHSSKEWVLLGSIPAREQWCRKIIAEFLSRRQKMRPK